MGWSPRVLAQCLAREGEFLALYIWGRKARGGRDAGPRAICPGPAAVAAAVGTPSSQLAGMLTSAGPSGPAPGGRRAPRSREWELCPTTPSRTGRWPLRSASSSTQSGAQEHRLPSFWGPSNLCPFLAAANDLSRVGHLSETVPHPPWSRKMSLRTMRPSDKVVPMYTLNLPQFHPFPKKPPHPPPHHQAGYHTPPLIGIKIQLP